MGGSWAWMGGGDRGADAEMLAISRGQRRMPDKDLSK